MSDTPLGKVGRYELIEKLATGGMAEVYKARALGDHGFQKLVAIKKILPHLAEDPAFVAMFIDEARITAMLEHPKIVQVFEFGDDAGELYIALQFINGLDLLSLLRKNERLQHKLPIGMAVHITHEILDALDYAHAARDPSGEWLGIIHRDISPSNVLLSRRGDVMLTDFGIAWAYEREHKTETGKLKGKMSYLSPELVAGADVDARSDLFSAGILLAEMLMGRRLFTAPNELDVLLMVRDAQLDRFTRYGSHIPASLQAIVVKALARLPDRRFSTAAAFRDALAEWLFSAKLRVAPPDVARFIQRIDDMETSSPDDGAGSPAGLSGVRSTLSGPTTQERKAVAIRAAQLGRELFTTAQPVPRRQPTSDGVPADVGDEVSSGARSEVSASAATHPSERGDFADVSPVRVLYRLAAREASGLLLAEGRAGILKEAYLSGGHPEFVASNVIDERLGEYMVAKGVISEDQLGRALAVMPHFGGHLADTVVGLGLIKPLELFRVLSQQVKDKLIDVCTWSKGRYRWYAGRKNPWPARKLHLDSYEIIGAGVAVIPVEAIVSWAKLVSSQRPRLDTIDPPLRRFGYGEAIGRVCDLMDGAQTIHELAARVQSPEARLKFLRIVYLLVECELVSLG